MMNKKNLVGILVILLAFGITVVGCDDSNGNDSNGNDSNGNGDTNVLDTYNFSTATPSSAVLAACDLTMEQFNQIKDAAGGGFRGWIDNDGDLLMAWTGRDSLNYINVADVLKEIREEKSRNANGPVYQTKGKNYILEFYTIKISLGNLYMPQGALLLEIFPLNTYLL